MPSGRGDAPVGRAKELAQASIFVDALTAGPAALLVEGEAGIGKTTVWQAVLAEARERGYRVVAATAVDDEIDLAFVALRDLLEAVPAAAQDTLPPVQREALDIALLRSAHRAAVADHQAVSAAVLGVIRALAAEQPLVVAVDDAGWLDRSSERVLRYVIRRLSDESVGIAAAFRPAADHQLPLGLDRPSVPDRLYRLELGPLDPDMVHMLLSLHASTHAGSPGRSTGCVAVIRSTPWRSPVRCAVMAGRRSLTACCRCRAVSWRVPRIGWRR